MVVWYQIWAFYCTVYIDAKSEFPQIISDIYVFSFPKIPYIYVFSFSSVALQ